MDEKVNDIVHVFNTIVDSVKDSESDFYSRPLLSF
jgi:hypothetical protein